MPALDHSMPPVDVSVVLRSPDGGSYTSHVEAVEPDGLTIREPLDLPEEHETQVGSELLVTWISPRGIGVLPVLLVDTYAQGLVPLWVVTVTGPGWHEQRRDYVRVPIGGTVALQSRESRWETSLLQGRLADISEAALRCSIETADAETLRVPGGDVIVSFSIAEHDFDLMGRIHTGRPNARAADRTDLVVLFDQPVPQADTLRRIVFTEQLRNRGN